MTRRCPLCDAPMSKVVYFGLPGRFCLSCDVLDGLATYGPPIATPTDDGPMFKFMVYEGSYWRALWRWLTPALHRRLYDEFEAVLSQTRAAGVAEGMAKAAEIARAAFDEYTEKHQAAVLADNERLYQALSLAMAASSKIAEAILAASPKGDEG